MQQNFIESTHDFCSEETSLFSPDLYKRRASASANQKPSKGERKGIVVEKASREVPRKLRREHFFSAI